MNRAPAGRPGAAAAGRSPGPPRTGPGTDVPHSIPRSYHPSQEGSLLNAAEYLAAPPAARTAAGAVGPAAMS